MFCSSLYTRFSLESVFAWCGPHRDWSHGEGPDSGPLVSVQGLCGQSGGQGTVQHRNKQVGGHGCQQLLILMLSAHHCKIQFFTLKLGQQQAYYFPSHYGLLPPIIVWACVLSLILHPQCFSMSCCGWNHNTVGFLSQVVIGRPLLSPLALIRPPSSSLSQACSCGRQTPLSQQLLRGLSAPDVAKHAISVPGEKKVVPPLTRNSNVSLEN